MVCPPGATLGPGLQVGAHRGYLSPHSYSQGRVVVAQARARVREPDAQPVEHPRPWCRCRRAAHARQSFWHGVCRCMSVRRSRHLHAGRAYARLRSRRGPAARNGGHRAVWPPAAIAPSLNSRWPTSAPTCAALPTASWPTTTGRDRSRWIRGSPVAPRCSTSSTPACSTAAPPCTTAHSHAARSPRVPRSCDWPDRGLRFSFDALVRHAGGSSLRAFLGGAAAGVGGRGQDAGGRVGRFAAASRSHWRSAARIRSRRAHRASPRNQKNWRCLRDGSSYFHFSGLGLLLYCRMWRMSFLSRSLTDAKMPRLITSR